MIVEDEPPILRDIKLEIEKAKQMLEANPDILIREVSNFLGYSDQFYFSKVFRKIAGTSPTDYKKTFLTKTSCLHNNILKRRLL